MLFVLCTSSAVSPPYDILSISFTSVASLPLPSVHLIAAGTRSCGVNTRPRGVEDGIIKPRTVLASKTNILIGRIMRACELPVTQEEVGEEAPELAGGVYESRERVSTVRDVHSAFGRLCAHAVRGCTVRGGDLMSP